MKQIPSGSSEFLGYYMKICSRLWYDEISSLICVPHMKPLPCSSLYLALLVTARA